MKRMTFYLSDKVVNGLTEKNKSKIVNEALEKFFFEATTREKNEKEIVGQILAAIQRLNERIEKANKNDASEKETIKNF